jgi:hypothetical protein
MMNVFCMKFQMCSHCSLWESIGWSRSPHSHGINNSCTGREDERKGGQLLRRRRSEAARKLISRCMRFHCRLVLIIYFVGSTRSRPDHEYSSNSDGDLSASARVHHRILPHSVFKQPVLISQVSNFLDRKKCLEGSPKKLLGIMQQGGSAK